jgi:hypothetical protein
MAKIKFGQIISEARGKIAGMVFSRNRSGNFIRTKVTPINPRSLAQGALRGNLAGIAKAWAGFTDAVRDEFTAHCGEGDRQNSIGDKVKLSGFNFYVGLCRVAKTLGIASPTSYPGSDEPTPLTTFSGTLSYAPDKVVITFTPAIAATEKMILSATRPMSLGRAPNPSDYRIIAALGSAATSPCDVTAQYVAKFGAIPPVGQQCYMAANNASTISFKKVARFKAGNDLASKIR